MCFSMTELCSNSPPSEWLFQFGDTKTLFLQLSSVWAHTITLDEVFELICANLRSALFLSLDSFLTFWPPRATSGAPGVHPRWPPGAAKHKGASVILPDKKANVQCSPLMSPAKHTGNPLGPLGFIDPFILLLQRVDRGVKFVRCSDWDLLTTSDTHTPRCIFPIHGVAFHIFHSSLNRYLMTENGSASITIWRPFIETYTHQCRLMSPSVIKAERPESLFLLSSPKRGNLGNSGKL